MGDVNKTCYKHRNDNLSQQVKKVIVVDASHVGSGRLNKLCGFLYHRFDRLIGRSCRQHL
jgi:hypothetical protein